MQDVCLFAHFDRGNIVDDYVFRYLDKLKELSFSIIFVTTSKIGENDRARLLTICDDVIVRENAGLDFGSWAAGFAKHESKITGRLLLANDSVYGPIGDLRPAFDRLIAVKADFYGFVQSADISTHVQSWFLLFENHVIRRPEFREAISRSFETMNKTEIIQYGEIGISSTLLAAGFSCRALYEVENTPALLRRFSLNPMHHLWYEMLVHEGVPFVKVELLRDNPAAIYDANLVQGVVAEIDPDIWNLISRHQQRMGGLISGGGLISIKPPLRSLGRHLGVSLQKLAKQAYYSNRAGRHLAKFIISTAGISIIVAVRVWSTLRKRGRA